MGVIYKIINPKNRIYIGKTICFRKRIITHKFNAKNDCDTILGRSIRKYGWDAHKLEIIEEIEDALLDEREIFWIKELKTYCYEYDGQLNMTKGGDGQQSTWMHDVERRKLHSEKFSGQRNPFFEKTHTKESRKIISDKAIERNRKNGKKVGAYSIKPLLVFNKRMELIFEMPSINECTKLFHISLSTIKNHIDNETYLLNKYLIKLKMVS